MGIKTIILYFIILILAINGCSSRQDDLPWQTINTSFDCNNLIGQNARDNCLRGIAQSTQDISICEKVQEQNMDACYIHLSLSSQNLAVCEKISDRNEMHRCYKQIAKEYKNATICVMIEDLTNKYQCFRDLAIETRNASFCDKIQNHTYSYIKKQCESALGVN